MKLHTFRNMSKLGLSRYEINLLGDVRNIITCKFLKHLFDTSDLDKKEIHGARFRPINDFGKMISWTIKDAVGETFWDLENPTGPYKDRILEVKEFMLLTPNDKRKVYDNFGLETKYIVTRFGDVWDMKKKKKLTPFTRVEDKQYLCVSINSSPIFIHRLVAMAFCPIPQHLLDHGHTFDTLTVNHIKGEEKTNNHWTNLEWCTRSENTSNAYEQNLNKGHSYSDDEIRKICQLIEKGYSISKIAKKCNTSRSYVFLLKKKHIRKDITSTYNFS